MNVHVYMNNIFTPIEMENLCKDKTTKRISCRVEVESTEDGLETIIRLGDVEAICTERT